MTRDILKRYTKQLNKEQIPQKEVKIPLPTKEHKVIDNLDDVIGILYDDNVKSKTVREIKCKKELVNYIQLRYQ